MTRLGRHFPRGVWENIKDYLGIWIFAKKNVIKSMPLNTCYNFTVFTSANAPIRFKKTFIHHRFLEEKRLILPNSSISIVIYEQL